MFLPRTPKLLTDTRSPVLILCILRKLPVMSSSKVSCAIAQNAEMSTIVAGGTQAPDKKRGLLGCFLLYIYL